MIEVDIMRQIQVALSKDGHRVFRNNVAVGWVGQLVKRHQDGTAILKNARPLHAGLCVGSSDLIGWTSRGVMLAIEVKTETGRATPEQLQFISAVRAAGGRAGIARSIQQAKDIADGKI